MFVREQRRLINCIGFVREVRRLRKFIVFVSEHSKLRIGVHRILGKCIVIIS